MKINLYKIKDSRYYLLIVIFTFVLYGNSIDNEYSMDDNLVTKGVAKVEKGLSGIPEIFTTPYVQGKQTYGYRPLVQVTYAMEKQIFSKLPISQTRKEKNRKNVLTQANISHFINVLLYAFLCIVLFSLLKILFDKFNVVLPFLVTLLFLVHPLHTEVVASLKNRDEILSLLFVLLSLSFFVKYSINNKLMNLLIASLFVLLAIFSKPNANALIALVPLFLFFKKVPVKHIIISTGSVLVMFVCFSIIKNGLTTEPSTRVFKFFENPLIGNNNIMERLALGFYSSWFYLEMLIYPKNLSFYYGHNQIPIANWSYWQVWGALLFYVPVGVFGIIQLVKRNILGLGISIWLGLMMGINNVLFPIVGIVADRFTFSLSIGFCIVVGYLILKVFKVDFSKEAINVNLSNGLLATIALVVLVYSVRTIVRNPNWHDEMTLYNHDIEHLNESAKANALLANVLYPIVAKEFQSNPMNPKNVKDIDRLIFHYKEAIRIDSTYLTSINNLGSVYMNFKRDYTQSIKYYSRAAAMNDDYVEAHFNLGYSYNAIGRVDEAIPHYIRVMEIKPDYMQVYKAYNKMIFDSGKLSEGIESLKKASEKIDKPKNIYLNIGNLYSVDNNNVEQSLVYFVKAYEQDQSDKKLCNHISTLFNSVGNVERANFYYSLCNN